MSKYFILWDIVDPRPESNPNPNPEPNPKPNPNPDPNCRFTISYNMKYLCRENEKPLLKTAVTNTKHPQWN